MCLLQLPAVDSISGPRDFPLPQQQTHKMGAIPMRSWNFLAPVLITSQSVHPKTPSSIPATPRLFPAALRVVA